MTATDHPLSWKNQLDEHKSKVFEEFKQKVAPYITRRHYDEYLFRFLKARQFDVNKAYDMFLNTLKWRQEYGTDNIRKTFPTSKYFSWLKEYWPASIVGQSKDGSYVFVERIGCVDPKSLLHAVPPDELLRFHVYVMEGHERLRRKQYKKYGYSLPIIIIQDCKGLGMKHTEKAGLYFIRTIAELDQANYPEMMRKMFLINAPAIFTMIYSMLKPFIDPVTLSKVEVLGSNFKDTLNELIDESTLPPCVGGTSDIPFPQAGIFETELSRIGTKVNIRSGDKYRHIVEVKSGSRVEYQFSTEDYNISFGIFYKVEQQSEDVTTLYEHRRVACHQLMEWQEITVENDGILIFEWDNSYSKFRSKDLTYHVKVHYPADCDTPPTATPKSRKKKNDTGNEESASAATSSSTQTSPKMSETACSSPQGSESGTPQIPRKKKKRDSGDEAD